MHVIIEADSPDSITIQDNHSLNKTWKNNVALKPGVLYGLEDGDLITMGEVKVKFTRKLADETADADDTGAETGSVFNVPETPSVGSSKKSSDGAGALFAPQSMSSPALAASAKPQVPDTPETPSAGECSAASASGLDNSSFLAPSQPFAPPPPKKAQTSAASSNGSTTPKTSSASASANIYDLETQKVDDEAPQVDSIFVAETQKIAETSSSATSESAAKSVFEEETQVVEAANGTDAEQKSIFEEETMVIDAEPVKAETEKGKEEELGEDEATGHENGVEADLKPPQNSDEVAENENPKEDDGGSSASVEPEKSKADVSAVDGDQEDPAGEATQLLGGDELLNNGGSPKTETQPFVPSNEPKEASTEPAPKESEDEEDENEDDEEEEEDFFQPTQPSKDSKDNANDDARSDASEHLLADSPSQLSIPSSPPSTSSTPASGQNVNVNDTTEEDIEDTKILDASRSSAVSHAEKDEATTVSASAGAKNDFSNGKDAADDDAEVSDDEVIPSSQDSMAFTSQGRTTWGVMSMDLTEANNRAKSKTMSPLSEEKRSSEEPLASTEVSEQGEEIPPADGEVGAEESDSFLLNPDVHNNSTAKIEDLEDKSELKETSPTDENTDKSMPKKASRIEEGGVSSSTVQNSKADSVMEDQEEQTGSASDSKSDIHLPEANEKSSEAAVVSPTPESDAGDHHDDTKAFSEPESEPLNLPSTQTFIADQVVKERNPAEDDLDDDEEVALVIDESKSGRNRTATPDATPSTSRGSRKRKSQAKPKKSSPPKRKLTYEEEQPEAKEKVTQKKSPKKSEATAVRRSGRATKKPVKLIEEDQKEDVVVKKPSPRATGEKKVVATERETESTPDKPRPSTSGGEVKTAEEANEPREKEPVTVTEVAEPAEKIEEKPKSRQRKSRDAAPARSSRSRASAVTANVQTTNTPKDTEENKPRPKRTRVAAVQKSPTEKPTPSGKQAKSGTKRSAPEKEEETKNDVAVSLESSRRAKRSVAAKSIEEKSTSAPRRASKRVVQQAVEPLTSDEISVKEEVQESPKKASPASKGKGKAAKAKADAQSKKSPKAEKVKTETALPNRSSRRTTRASVTNHEDTLEEEPSKDSPTLEPPKASSRGSRAAPKKRASKVTKTVVETIEDKDEKGEARPEQPTRQSRRRTRPGAAATATAEPEADASPKKRRKTEEGKPAISPGSALKPKRRTLERVISLINVLAIHIAVISKFFCMQESSCSSRDSSSSGRRKPRDVVMFTGYDDPADKKLVAELGGKVTDSVSDCTVLVTDKIRRTTKFLCMVAKGVPIVGPKWLQLSKETKSFQGEYYCRFF